MIDVAYTRRELRPAYVAVVVDVLRATSTVTQALASGYRRVLVAESLDLARQLRGPGRVLAGERHCIKPPGFDQGNSPTDALEPYGQELVLATTNGAPTIVESAKRSRRVLLACVLNLAAVAEALLQPRGEPAQDVQIVCSGTDGAVALEDVYLAGRLCAALPGERTDAARVAEGLARGFATPLDALAASADAAVLRRADLAGDIVYCAFESALALVPSVIAVGTGVAAVADLRAHTESELVVDATGTVSV